MEAKARYKIRELPNGLYRIEVLVDGTKDDWIWSKTPEQYKTFKDAEDAIRRLIAYREWYYDARGDPV